LGLALDESNEEDLLVTERGIDVLGDEIVRKQIRDFDGVTVDFIGDDRYGRGFIVRLNSQAAGGC
jgi:hypothetical protein